MASGCALNSQPTVFSQATFMTSLQAARALKQRSRSYGVHLATCSSPGTQWIISSFSSGPLSPFSREVALRNTFCFIRPFSLNFARMYTAQGRGSAISLLQVCSKASFSKSFTPSADLYRPNRSGRSSVMGAEDSADSVRQAHNNRTLPRGIAEIPAGLSVKNLSRPGLRNTGEVLRERLFCRRPSSHKQGEPRLYLIGEIQDPGNPKSGDLRVLSVKRNGRFNVKTVVCDNFNRISALLPVQFRKRMSNHLSCFADCSVHRSRAAQIFSCLDRKTKKYVL